MRIIVEESSTNNDNKRRITVECESDNIPLEETLDMILRGLLSYGYTSQDISDTLIKFTQPVEQEPGPDTEQPTQTIGEI